MENHLKFVPLNIVAVRTASWGGQVAWPPPLAPCHLFPFGACPLAACPLCNFSHCHCLPSAICYPLSCSSPSSGPVHAAVAALALGWVGAEAGAGTTPLPLGSLTPFSPHCIIFPILSPAPCCLPHVRPPSPTHYMIFPVFPHHEPSPSQLHKPSQGTLAMARQQYHQQWQLFWLWPWYFNLRWNSPSPPPELKGGGETSS